MDEKLENISNSHKVRNGETVPNKVVERPKVKGKVGVRKKNGVTKFVEAFLPEDVSDVKTFIISDVVIPSVKKILDDIFHTILYGSTDRSYYSSNRGSSGSRVSYQNYFDRRSSSSSQRSRRNESIYVLDDDFVFEFEREADDFIRWIMDEINEVGFVRLSDVNEYVGRTGYHTDNHYGWKSINGFKITNYGRGDEQEFVVRLPRPFPID